MSRPLTVRPAAVAAAAFFLVAMWLLTAGARPLEAADPPTVTGISPASGAAAGGTAVTITGTGFAAGATVTFNGTPATGVTVVNATTITASTPAGTGSATVVVTNTDGLGGSLGGAFLYLGPPPTVTGVSPASGSTLGGTNVTITGTGFQSGATVRFGGVLATNVSVTNSTTITARTPAGSPGTVAVQVTNADTQSGSLSNAFAYQAAPPPSITSLSPSSGTTGGGTTVTITGTGFAAGASVRFGNSDATSVTVNSATSITAVTPSGSAGAVTVRVTNADGQVGQLNSAYTYVSTPAPTVSAVSPASAPRTGGTVVTITGTGFLPGAVARFGSTNATSTTVVSPTQITAVTPSAAGTGTVNVVVTNTDGKSGTRTNGFTYTGTLSVTSVSPNVGSTGGGTPVTITGTGFVTGATVRFASTNATSVVVNSSTQITAVAPARSSGTVTVQVTIPGGESASLNNAFTYVTSGTPTISAVSPAGGPLGGGNLVTITGTNFNPGATVQFGGRAATAVSVVSSTQITALVPAGSSLGNVSVRVTNTDTRTVQQSNAYRYVAAPTLTSVSPAAGTTVGGTTVTLTGTNFVSGMTVTFGGIVATDVNVTSNTTLTARTPARSAGTVAVIVQTPSGLASQNNAFTYHQPAVVTGVSPSTGPTTGGTLVTITGAGFTAGSTVSLDGTAATNVTVVSSTQITARTPARAAGTASVQVRSSEGVLATGTPAFTYVAASGAIVGGALPTTGVSLFIYGGGSTSELVNLGVAGCPATRLSFWSTVNGRFVSYFPSLPSFVNSAWDARFPGGIPANTPLLGYCR